MLALGEKLLNPALAGWEVSDANWIDEGLTTLLAHYWANLAMIEKYIRTTIWSVQATAMKVRAPPRLPHWGLP